MSKSNIHISDSTIALFWHYPSDEPADVQKKLLHIEKGPYLYFRRIKTAIQARLCELIDHSTIPQVFIHGSPHIDNYAKTLTGYGMVDFDRAHIAPYVWDIVCVLIALGLREVESFDYFLIKKIPDALLESYTQGFQFPELSYREYEPLANISIKDWEKNTNAYLNSEKKWAKKILSNRLDLDDPIAHEVLHQYLASRNEIELLDDFKVTHIARTAGTFGRPRFLIALKSKNKQEDAILLDIKQTRNYNISAWPHNQWYHHSYDHQGKRMIAASKLYAPNCSLREGYATVNGVEYWGRQVPTLNRKPGKIISQNDQLDFAITAGSQLGRGHRLSLEGVTSDYFLQHFHDNFTDYVMIAKQIHGEIMATWRLYLKKFS